MNEGLNYFLRMVVAAFFLYIITRLKKNDINGTFIKTMTSLIFIIVGLISTYFGGNLLFGVIVMMGLIFGLIGDIFLDIKSPYGEDSEKYLLGGMISFASGHIMYLAATFLSIYNIGGNIISVIVIPAVLALLFTLFIFKGAPLLNIQFGKFTIPCFAYSLLLSFWAFVTGSNMIKTEFSLFWSLLFAGAALFLISDMVLVFLLFGKHKSYPSRNISSLNLVTYYLAQILIALSILNAI